MIVTWVISRNTQIFSIGISPAAASKWTWWGQRFSCLPEVSPGYITQGCCCMGIEGEKFLLHFLKLSFIGAVHCCWCQPVNYFGVWISMYTYTYTYTNTHNIIFLNFFSEISTVLEVPWTEERRINPSKKAQPKWTFSPYWLKNFHDIPFKNKPQLSQCTIQTYYFLLVH